MNQKKKLNFSSSNNEIDRDSSENSLNEINDFYFDEYEDINKLSIKCLNYWELRDSKLLRLLPIINPTNYRGSQDIICDICLDKQNYEKDIIHVCKICYSATHQSCYGSEIYNQASDSWTCQRCREVNFKFLAYDKIQCFLCPSDELMGLIKKVGKRKWAHVDCVNWNPYTYFEDHWKETIVLPPNFSSTSTSLICYICRKKEGSCMQCDYSNCTIAFHVKCAKRNNMILHWEIMDSLRVYYKEDR